MAKLTITEKSQSLKNSIREQITYCQDHLLTLTSEAFNFKPATDSWSKGECIDHLNKVLNHYVPQLEKRVAEKDQHSKKKNSVFKPGLLGGYMARSMAPGTDGTIKNKMKTFKQMNPGSSLNRDEVIGDFFEFSHRLMKICDALPNTKLKARVKTPIKGVSIRITEAVELMVNHNSRHLLQAKRVSVTS